MKHVLVIEVRREGYSIDQVRRTMTVGELIDVLEDYDRNLPIYLSHDEGYTYGSIDTQYMEERYEREDGDYDEEGYEDPDFQIEED